VHGRWHGGKAPKNGCKRAIWRNTPDVKNPRGIGGKRTSGAFVGNGGGERVAISFEIHAAAARRKRLRRNVRGGGGRSRIAILTLPTKRRASQTGAWHGKSIANRANPGAPVGWRVGGSHHSTLRGDCAPYGVRRKKPAARQGAHKVTYTRRGARAMQAKPIMAIVSIKTQRVTFLRTAATAGSGEPCVDRQIRDARLKADVRASRRQGPPLTSLTDRARCEHARINWNGYARTEGPCPGSGLTRLRSAAFLALRRIWFDKTRIGMVVYHLAGTTRLRSRFPPRRCSCERRRHVAEALSRARCWSRGRRGAVKTADEREGRRDRAHETRIDSRVVCAGEGLKRSADAELGVRRPGVRRRKKGPRPGRRRID